MLFLNHPPTTEIYTLSLHDALPISYRDTKRNVDVKCELRDEQRMLFILSAASGLRFGEALGIEIPHVWADGSCINIGQKAWRGQMHDTETRNGETAIDLSPAVAHILTECIGER